MHNVLSIIKNAAFSGKQITFCRKTRNNAIVLELLYQHGFIRGYLFRQGVVVILLKYIAGKSVIENVRLMSRASKNCSGNSRVVSSYNSKPGLVVVSCKNGVFSSNAVSLLGMGGIVLFHII